MISLKDGELTKIRDVLTERPWRGTDDFIPLNDVGCHMHRFRVN